VEILEVGGAGRRVTDARALGDALIEAFDDPEACRQRGAIGREALEAHRGSVEATRRLIEEVLARHAPEPHLPRPGGPASQRSPAPGHAGASVPLSSSISLDLQGVHREDHSMVIRQHAT